MLIRLTGECLEVANTGAPLTAGGVSAAATMRASAKRAGISVGHFGVGFAAVLSVTDAPELISWAGGVRWSREASRAAVAAVPSLATELEQRAGHVPVLRLPYPVASPTVPDGYDTVVRMPLAAGAPAFARRLLESLDPTLLLVLPALAAVVVELDPKSGAAPEVSGRTFTCTWDGPDATLDGKHWTGVIHRGKLDRDLLATRGVEEQSRDTYEIRVLMPEAEWPEHVPKVLRAPQPTDEPLSFPALVVGSLPVDPGRRRIVPGPLADRLLDDIVAALVELAERTGDLRLVPTALPAGPVDAAIADALRDRLPEARMLPGGRRGADAVVLDLGPANDTVSDLLRGDLPALLPARFTGPRWAAARRVLGVTEIGAGELVTMLAGLARSPAWWSALYPALRAIADRDALAALPVPLADGRTVTGPRGVLLLGAGLDASALTGLPLRLADPVVSSGPSGELLRGLGAIDADPAALLADPAVTGDDVPYQAVLALVAALGDGHHGVPDDLGERLLLPGDDGELWPAAELLLPSGPLAQVASPDAPFGRLTAEVAHAYDPAVLAAAGVLRTFSVLRASDVLLDPDDSVLLALDASDEWVAQLPAGAGPVVSEFTAIRDLELVRWPAALAVLAGPEMRADVLGSPYTCWWLSAHPVMPGGLLPGETALPGELEVLYEPAPEGFDADFLAAIGVRTSVSALAEPADLYDLLDRLGDPHRDVDWPPARRLYLEVTALLEQMDASDEEPPDFVRTPSGAVPREHAAVVDRPDLLPLLGSRAALRVPTERAAIVARLLGVAPASSLTYEVVGERPLQVRDADGTVQKVAWFGGLHDGTPEGRARAQAWSSGRWHDRHALAAALRDPDAIDALAAEADLDS